MSWRERRLSTLASYQNGRAFKPEDFTEKGLPVIRIRQLLDSDVEPDRYDGPYDVSYYIESGDLILSWSATLAVCSWRRGPALLNQHLFKVVPWHDVDGRWLHYALEHVVPYLEGLMRGSAMTHITGEVLKSVRIPCPPLGEQRIIADFLDSESAGIDQLAEMKSSLIDRLQDRRKALVANAVPGLADVRFGSDGIPFVMTQHPVVRLGHVASVQTGMTLDAGRATADEEVELPYLRVANVQDGWVDLEEVKDVVVPQSIANSSRLAPGDVLMTEGGDPDKLGRGTVWEGQIEECLHQNHIFAVRPVPDRLLSSYLALLTRTPLARTYFEVTASKTTGIASTSSGKIRSWRIPLPPVEEQEQAVKRMSERERILVEAIERLQRQLDVLAERRQSLITAAVSGQLDVGTHVGTAS